MPTIQYTTAQNIEDLRQILHLQQENLEACITKEELHQEGFVTVSHSLELLEEMNTPFAHVMAKEGDEVVGYTLVMLKNMAQRIPILIPMFGQINALSYEGNLLSQTNYFIMGQVCIKKGYRGKGVFKGMYDELKRQMSSGFTYVITEVASRNQRSIKAHQKQGFEVLHTYIATEEKEEEEEEEEEWVILIWNLTLDKP
jgi:ribosomal protein S18 acetylase RimI-like enzyme